MFKLITKVLVIFAGLTQIVWCDECDSPPNFKEMINCCKIPLLIDPDLHNACAKELKVESSTEYDGAMEFKMSECVFKKIDAIIDGKPSANEIKKFSKKILDEHPGWEKTFNEAVDKCVPHVIAEDAETRKRASEPPFNIDKTTNPMYAHLVECIGTELLLECPEVARGGDTATCDAIKSGWKKCSKQFPPQFLAGVH